jgi:hypothetical protein
MPSAQAKPLHASSLQQELLQKMAHRTPRAQRVVKRAHIVLEALKGTVAPALPCISRSMMIRC